MEKKKYNTFKELFSEKQEVTLGYLTLCVYSQFILLLLLIGKVLEAL